MLGDRECYNKVNKKDIFIFYNYCFIRLLLFYVFFVIWNFYVDSFVDIYGVSKVSI